MDLDVPPKFRPLGLYNVDGGSAYGPHAGRGRLAIRHDLVRDEHGLFSGGCEAGLPGKLCQEFSDAVMSPDVEAFRAASCVATM